MLMELAARRNLGSQGRSEPRAGNPLKSGTSTTWCQSRWRGKGDAQNRGRPWFSPLPACDLLTGSRNNIERPLWTRDNFTRPIRSRPRTTLSQRTPAGEAPFSGIDPDGKPPGSAGVFGSEAARRMPVTGSPAEEPYPVPARPVGFPIHQCDLPEGFCKQRASRKGGAFCLHITGSVSSPPEMRYVMRTFSGLAR